MRSLHRPTVLSAVLLVIGSVSVKADDEKPERRTISVSGEGKMSGAPNVASINAGVVTQAKTAREALSANNEKMAALQGVLKERGVAAKDVQTTNISVQPQYTQPPPFQPGQPQREFVPQIVGYQVQNTVHIKVRDLAKLGVILDAVVESGANQMHGISFHIDQPGSLLDSARKHAMADAKKKAELMAGEAGVVVGPPISIRDEVASFPQPPPMFGAMRGMAAAPSAVPVATGEQELSVTVHVVYELKLPK
ncbi:MAG: hypothetical protein JWN86_2675 [Planctomycetota bacterium]|nr:hypothetical protein [Planctomycetota bacterium]